MQVGEETPILVERSSIHSYTRLVNHMFTPSGTVSGFYVPCTERTPGWAAFVLTPRSTQVGSDRRAGMLSRVLRRVPAPVKARAQSSAAKQSQHARTIDDLRTPALCCYPSVMEANAKAMLDRASRLGCVLRPHVKTAKTLQAATIQTGGTKRRVVVSTVAEAEFLASGGFDDILYAVPITEDKFGAADELNQRLERFHVVVDHPRTVRALTSRAVTKPLSVVVMVDCGELTYFTVVSSNVSGLVSRDVAER